VKVPVGAVEAGLTTPRTAIVIVWAGIFPRLALNPLNIKEVEFWVQATAEELMLPPVRVAQLVEGNDVVRVAGKLIWI